jgi:hypothetical protein
MPAGSGIVPRVLDDIARAQAGMVSRAQAHPEPARFRDHRRDNAAVVAGGRVLRYGYTDVVERPCAVAREVASVLAAAGWVGRARRCGPGCVNGETLPGVGMEELPR